MSIQYDYALYNCPVTIPVTIQTRLFPLNFSLSTFFFFEASRNRQTRRLSGKGSLTKIVTLKLYRNDIKDYYASPLSRRSLRGGSETGVTRKTSAGCRNKFFKTSCVIFFYRFLLSHYENAKLTFFFSVPYNYWITLLWRVMV